MAKVFAPSSWQIGLKHTTLNDAFNFQDIFIIAAVENIPMGKQHQ